MVEMEDLNPFLGHLHKEEQWLNEQDCFVLFCFFLYVQPCRILWCTLQNTWEDLIHLVTQ